MGTTIRPELSEKNPYWIERHRYYELKDLSLRKLEHIPQQHSEDCSIVLDRQRNN